MSTPRESRLHALLEVLRRDTWPYLAAPPLLTAVFVGFDEHIPLSMAPHLLRDIFVFVVCIGAPVQLTYHLLGPHIGLGNFLRLRDLPIHAAIIAAGVAVGTELGFVLLAPFHDPSFPLEERIPSRPAIWLMGAVGDTLVTALMIAFGHYRERIEEAQLRELRARQEALAAQVQALQARIQPHFLFNSLNTVASLVQEDPRRAEAAVEKLSELLRYTLDASRRAFVPLAEELAAVEGYLEIEALRHGERLKVAVHADPAAADVPVPPLVLQPVVENAVLHGIAPRREGGRLEVYAQRREGALVLRVEDDGPGPGGSLHHGTGTALADLRRRLTLLYGSAATLEVSPSALGGCSVAIALPLRPAAAAPA